MKKNKGKQILRQVLTAAVIIVGFTCFLIPVKADFKVGDFYSSASDKFERRNVHEQYRLGDSQRLYISIEHYKEKNGYTPVVLSIGSLMMIKYMDVNGSVFDYMNTNNNNGVPLLSINWEEGYLLIGNEAIPCEITLTGKMRTRLRLTGENANAVVTVSKDKKEGELFLFNGRVKAESLHFMREETANSDSEVEIIGPDCHGMEKFIFDEETRILYSVDEYKQQKGKKEREQRRLSFSSYNSEENIPITERQALIALYNSTNGDSWESNNGWKTPPLEADGFSAYGSEGTWYGIIVESDHVTQVNLYRNCLKGTIPPELGNLDYLVTLRLCENTLLGSIPPELGSLSNLESLDLGHNNLSGNIPPELGNLSNILLISLDNNSLSSSIPIELSYLSGVLYIDLGNNNFSGSIPPELGNLNNIETLSLSRNLLSGTIPPELVNLSKLEVLYLNFNSLSGSIPSELGNLSGLEALYLNFNSLSGSIPPEFGNLGELYILILTSNQLSGTIPLELANINNLSNLYLNNNFFSGGIPIELCNSNRLFALFLNNNFLIGSIPKELGNVNTLRYIYLNNNSLSGNIPPELGNLSKVRELYLQSNMLSGMIPQNLINLTDIRQTDIGYNALCTDNSALIEFLNEKDPDWAETQTIAPTNLSASLVSPTSIRLSWEPITYDDEPGGYKVYIGTSRPYTLYGTTANKSVSSMQVDGLVPGTTYYFALRTVTYPHSNNQNTVTSQFSSIGSYTIYSLNIQSPNGGENLTLNTTHNITWEAVDLSNNVHIILEQDGVKVALIARDIDPAPGSYSWKVGDCLKGAVTPGTNYKVLIKEKNSGVEDRSDKPFSICEPFLTVTAPNGGENWTLNASRDITWLASGLSHNINIILEQNGIKVALIARDINPIRGSYTWKVGECLLGSVSAGTDYKIVLKEKNSTVKDKSNNSFSIAEPSIIVTSPNGGENWEIGSTHDITWQAAGIAGNLKITLWKDGSLVGVIANNINPYSGSLSWTAGQHSGGTAAPGSGYRIKIKEKDSPISDTGGDFTLTN